jgi:hypothetical protein
MHGGEVRRPAMIGPRDEFTIRLSVLGNRQMRASRDPPPWRRGGCSWSIRIDAATVLKMLVKL